MVFGVPESPRWLMIKKKNEAAARKVLTMVNPEGTDQVIEEIRHAQNSFTGDRLVLSAIRPGRYCLHS